MNNESVARRWWASVSFLLLLSAWMSVVATAQAASFALPDYRPDYRAVTPQSGGPIVFGQTVQGAIDATDPSLSGGGPRFDEYFFSTQSPGQGYVITAQSTELALQAVLFMEDATQQQLLPVQTAYVFNPGAQVQFSGTLEQAGNYSIIVFDATGDPNSTGTYTLSLTESAAGVVPGSCEGGTIEAPVAITDGQTLDCQLGSTDLQLTDGDGYGYYAKFFRFTSNGGPYTIAAASADFTPVVLLFDPVNGQFVAGEVGALTIDLPQGDAMYAVTSVEPLATGAFQASLASGAPGGDGSPF